MQKIHARFLGLIAALALVVLAAAPPSAHAAFNCLRQNGTTNFNYYSDATKTVMVGTCQDDCGACECTGSQSAFFNRRDVPVC